ncbi:cytochrome oxidase small assembly protein [Piscinibacter sp.]|nr:cytochrome oxidase small assembly protein [Piscinibacter sp.]MBP5988411.1 cytochrome oxidase small assembly protein [Piscinibacter sp.]MBP6026101.1 cytochrome oxidase small assembly protein [Piscinibacter sp.]
MSTQEQQKKANVRLALILASVAVALFIGFVAKTALFGL